MRLSLGGIVLICFVFRRDYFKIEWTWQELGVCFFSPISLDLESGSEYTEPYLYQMNVEKSAWPDFQVPGKIVLPTEPCWHCQHQHRLLCFLSQCQRQSAHIILMERDTFIVIFLDISRSEVFLLRLGCGEGGFRGSCVMSRRVTLVWAAGPFPQGRLSDTQSWNGDLCCVLREGGAFSAAQADPDATRTAWSWDRAFSSPVVGCGQLVMTNPG